MVALCIFFSSFVNAATIIKCKDLSGNVVFTQNKDDCDKNYNHTSATYTENKSENNKHKVNYRAPYREYINIQGNWEIYIESSLRDGNYKLYKSSLRKLEKVLNEVFSILPASAAIKLSSLKFFLLWGEKSPPGGRKSGMSYIRKDESDNYYYLDKRWEHSIVIYSAENLIYLNDLWSKKAVMHELSHTWHILNWPEKHPPIYDSWRNARDSGLYLNMRKLKGGIIKSANSRKNQLEYFAEFSAIYFVGGNYHPFDREGLKNYDPSGYKMIESLWK